MSVFDDLEERKSLIQSIFKILTDWKLDTDIQVVLVGLDGSTKARELTKLKNGKNFPDEDDFMRRALLIISISQALHLVFAGNQTLADLWITTPTHTFNDCAPIEIMINGLEGLNKINKHLRGAW